MNMLKKYSLTFLIVIGSIFFAASCLSMGKTLKSPSHNKDVDKTMVACQQRHVTMHGSDFKWRQSFCYTWVNRDKKGKPILNKKKERVWHVKVYDFIKHHEMFVQRGPWTVTEFRINKGPQFRGPSYREKLNAPTKEL